MAITITAVNVGCFWYCLGIFRCVHCCNRNGPKCWDDDEHHSW